MIYYVSVSVAHWHLTCVFLVSRAGQSYWVPFNQVFIYKSTSMHFAPLSLCKWSVRNIVHMTRAHLCKIASGLNSKSWITVARYLHRIWIASETSLVKWVPRIHFTKDVPFTIQIRWKSCVILIQIQIKSLSQILTQHDSIAIVAYTKKCKFGNQELNYIKTEFASNLNRNAQL